MTIAAPVTRPRSYVQRTMLMYLPWGVGRGLRWRYCSESGLTLKPLIQVRMMLT
jgi:hypothetical protein